ncbi:30S ribosomal protein S14 [Halorientalis sp.]|uniref:30S ribosomal protein S14 n=1 Tax=Halorientalis sp. TaxID=1931229 RepID=UPI002614ED48|nr:30S ribosomal protein S14 [Halorientalis sp.]
MTRDSTDASSDIERSTDDSDDRRVCRMTGREDGLVGKYDIWLCRQSFRELARDVGFEKYD